MGWTARLLLVSALAATCVACQSHPREGSRADDAGPANGDPNVGSASAEGPSDAAASSTSLEASDAALPPLATEPAGAPPEPPGFVECSPRLPRGLPGRSCPLACGPGYCTYDEAGTPSCACPAGRAGDACDRCDDGYERQPDGRCLSACQLGGAPCWGGKCVGTQASPLCECSAGYAGAQCEECAPGFGPVPGVISEDGVLCGPTCRDSCSPAEECVLQEPGDPASAQLCRCASGYHRQAAGDCAWDGVVADPDLAFGCAAWEVVEWAPNEGTTARANVRDYEITLEVSHVCAAAAAVAAAHFPAPDTVPNGALRFEANGTRGSFLDVSLSASQGIELPLRQGPFGGTGQWEVHTVCLNRPPPREGFVTFMVGLPGDCAERVDHAFRIRALSEVSVDGCEN